MQIYKAANLITGSALHRSHEWSFNEGEINAGNERCCSRVHLIITKTLFYYCYSSLKYYNLIMERFNNLSMTLRTFFLKDWSRDTITLSFNCSTETLPSIRLGATNFINGNDPRKPVQRLILAKKRFLSALLNLSRCSFWEIVEGTSSCILSSLWIDPRQFRYVRCCNLSETNPYLGSYVLYFLYVSPWTTESRQKYIS